jgi:hypothetical protein
VDGEVAPIPDLPVLAPERRGSTLKLPFAAREKSAARDPRATKAAHKGDHCDLPSIRHYAIWVFDKIFLIKLKM